jgi:hypothetical protein
MDSRILIKPVSRYQKHRASQEEGSRFATETQTLRPNARKHATPHRGITCRVEMAAFWSRRFVRISGLQTVCRIEF